MKTSVITRHGLQLFCKDHRYHPTIGVGPQQAAFEYGTKLNHMCYVMYQYELSASKKPLYAYGSLPDKQALCELMSTIRVFDRCFFEIIREDTPCYEYYDIEWSLTATTAEGMRDEEEAVFWSLMMVYSKDKVEREELAARMRVLSASSIEDSMRKGSLHVIGPRRFRNNHRDLYEYIHQHIKPNVPESLYTKIDWLVYTRNRTFRLYEQHKRKDMSRPLVPPEWHTASKHADVHEFFIACPEEKGFFNYERSAIACMEKNKHSSSNSPVETPYSGEHQEHNLYSIFVDKYSSRYTMEPITTTLVRLKLKGIWPCLVCHRRHESENALLRMSNNKAFFRCLRDTRWVEVCQDMKAYPKSGEHVAAQTVDSSGQQVLLQGGHAALCVSSSTKRQPRARCGYDSMLRSIYAYPAMNRWELFLSKPHRMNVTDLKKDIEYAVYGYNKDALIIYRHPDMMVLYDASLAKTICDIDKSRVMRVVEIPPYTWMVCDDNSPLSTLIYSGGSTSLYPLDVTKKEAFLVSEAPSRCLRLSSVCKNIHVYTIYMFFKAAREIYVYIEDDLKKRSWVSLPKNSPLYKIYNQEHPLVYRFVYKK